MNIIMALALLTVISILAFWRPHPVLFMIMAGISLMTGLYWFDFYTNELGMAISLVLIGYCFLCLGYTFMVIFREGGRE